MPGLILGPMLRYADARAATVWVQTDVACEVEICGARERTWCVDGLHFALLVIEGLEPDVDHRYEVRLDGELAWPPADSELPPSTIRLPGAADRREVVFGSCRIALPHEPPFVLRAHEHPSGQGIDALRAFALRLAAAGGGPACPDLLLMLGDQIYADQPSPALRDELARRPRPDDAPADELADFGEYALAYREAWSEPLVRWLLSTVPTAMIFDDHEIHAEWRISQGWLEELEREPWFERHIRGGMIAYWVFQHLGNLSPGELRAEGVLAAVHEADDAAGTLEAWVGGEGRQAGHSRWSFSREVGESRLVVVDSRAGRQVAPGSRRLIQEEEWAWISEQARRPARHLVLASSVPFLLAPALHYAEAWDEAVAEGAWGPVGRRAGEWLRRLAVMDHWAAFQASYRSFVELIDDIAHGREGAAPASVVLLSGDVHHCYLAQAEFTGGEGPHSPVWQAVCSGFRKELVPHERAVIALGHTRSVGWLARRLARAARVPALPFGWRIVDRPAYANQIATLTLDGDAAQVRVEAVVDGTWERPRLEIAFERALAGPRADPEPEAEGAAALPV